MAAATSAFNSHHPDQSAAINVEARLPPPAQTLGLTEVSYDGSY